MQTTSKALLAVLAGSALALSGCGGGKENSNTIRIGADVELTGNVASWGTSVKNGAEMAVKEINDSGGINGKKLELVAADNRGEVSEASNALQKLLDDKIVAVIGPEPSSCVLGVKPMIQDSKIPLITPTGTNPRIIRNDDGSTAPYMFVATFNDNFQGKVMANFAYKVLHAKKAAIFVDNTSDYSKGLQKVFKNDFTQLGGDIVIEEAFLQKDTDFRASLTKINASSPDVIFLPDSYQEVGLIIKQAREMGIQIPILGGDGWDSAKLAEIAGTENLNNTYYSTHYSTEEKVPVSISFVENYQKLYGEKPDSFAALGYDSAKLIADAIKKAGTADPQKIRDELEQTTDFQGVTGKVIIGKDHNPIKAAFIISYKDGKQVLADKILP